MAGKVWGETWQALPINRKVHIKKCWQQWEREFPLSSSTRPPANLHVTLFLSRPSFFIKLCCIPRWNSRHRPLCHLSQNFWLVAFFIWKTIHMIALNPGPPFVFVEATHIFPVQFVLCLIEFAKIATVRKKMMRVEFVLCFFVCSHNIFCSVIFCKLQVCIFYLMKLSCNLQKLFSYLVYRD